MLGEMLGLLVVVNTIVSPAVKDHIHQGSLQLAGWPRLTQCLTTVSFSTQRLKRGGADIMSTQSLEGSNFRPGLSNSNIYLNT